MQVSSKTDRPKELDFSTRYLGSDASRSNTGFDQDNPSPQSGKDLPLKDLTVYPEVFSNETNISETTHGYLEKLGAKIEKRINKKCNVIIWKDGSIKTLEKAREYGIPVVSLLWLEDCTDHFHRADFAKYTKSLPTETEMPFLALQETKKRKSFDIPEDEDPFLGGIPQDLLKPTLKKKKKNTSDDEDKKGDKFSLRFDDDSKKKNLRRSQTTKPAPSAGSWLLTINDSEKKESSFASRNKAEKTQKTEKPLKNSSNDDWQGSSNLNIESIFQKKKTEEDSAKVRSMIFKYARSGSLGGDDSFDVNDTSYNKENDDKDESNKSYSLDESREDEKRDRWASKFDDENSNSKSKSFMSRSMSLGEKSYSSLLEDEPKTFGFRTRVMLREERQNFENERQKEKRAGEDSAGKRDNSFDIGIRAREELFKKEGANFGKISEIWSKYTGKADPKAKESKEKEDQKNKMEEEPMANSRNLKKDKISSLDKGRELPDRRVSARKTVEKKSSTGSDSEEDIVVQRKGKESLSKKLINYNKDEDTPRKTDDKKVTPAQLSKSVKLETPTRKTTTSTAELEKTQDTRYSSEIKTPQTKQPYSLSKSSLIGKYLGSASSNNEHSPSPFASSVENGSSTKKKETEDSESYLSGLRNNGVRNLIAGLEPSKTKKKSSFEEEKEESEEEEFMTKTIKKRTEDKKKEDLVLFSGISGKSLAKAQEFCKKFNFKLIEDELRNLSRADFLVYEGNEIPKNYRVAFTMMRGKPIVNLDWVEESVKNGKLSNYKEHEFCYSPEGRKKLLAGLRFYIDKEFEGQTGNMVLKKDMVNLLEQSNGKIFDNVRSCDFCVMKKMGKKSSDIPAHVKIITPQWIIDSIIEGKLLSTDAINYNF